jgi:acyl-coenzyme A synthetase/AMP-(fatty) acid ligase
MTNHAQTFAGLKFIPTWSRPLEGKRADIHVQEVGIQTAVISGGASLAPHLEDFYEAAGLPILNGWGLTETAPVIACRCMGAENPVANVRGTVGKELQRTSVKYVLATCIYKANM